MNPALTFGAFNLISHSIYLIRSGYGSLFFAIISSSSERIIREIRCFFVVARLLHHHRTEYKMENGNYGTANYRNPIKMCDWNHFFRCIQWVFWGVSTNRTLRTPDEGSIWLGVQTGRVDCIDDKLQLNATNTKQSILYRTRFALFWVEFICGTHVEWKAEPLVAFGLFIFQLVDFSSAQKRHLFFRATWEIHLPTSNFIQT